MSAQLQFTTKDVFGAGVLSACRKALDLPNSAEELRRISHVLALLERGKISQTVAFNLIAQRG